MANPGIGSRNGTGQGRNGTNGGSFTGEIISKDDRSIVIKMPDGGSKIIFYSESTKVTKFTDGNSDDLTVGKTVSASGTSNQDGSMTAQSVQLRPAVIN